MRKNLIAIETATILILIAMLITGVVLMNTYIIFLAVCLLMLGGIGIAIYKIVSLYKKTKPISDNADNSKADNIDNLKNSKTPIANPKKAWEFSTIGEKIKSLCFIFTFTACCIAFMILCMYGYFKAALITIFTGISVIVLAIIIMAVIEKLLIEKHKKELQSTNNINTEIESNQEACENIDFEDISPASQDNISEELDNIKNDLA